MKRMQIWNWIPALLTMAAIFWFSSQPADELPVFSWADMIIKKSGHIIGYALLAFWYWYGLGMDQNKRWLAWLLAIVYALTDEFHQTFVSGRNASLWDVVILDNLGALISLWLAGKWIKQKRPDRNAGSFHL